MKKTTTKKKAMRHRPYRRTAATTGLAILALGALSSCNKGVSQAEYEDVIEKLDSLKKEVGYLEDDHKDEIEKLTKEISKKEETNSDLQFEIDQLKSQLDDAQKATETAQQEFEEFKKKFLSEAREKAVGLQIAHLKLENGKMYQNVTVRKINPMAVLFHHEAGPMTAALADFPEPYRTKMGYDPVEAYAFLKAWEEKKIASNEASTDTGSGVPKGDVDWDSQRKKLEREQNVRKNAMSQYEFHMKRLTRLLAVNQKEIDLIKKKKQAAFSRDSSKDWRVELNHLSSEQSKIRAEYARIKAEWNKLKTG